MPSTLTRSDYESWLVTLYFGRDGTAFERCMNRAYGDFKRTLRRIRNHRPAASARDRAKGVLIDSFSTIRDANGGSGQEEFDAWHRQTCASLSEAYQRCGWNEFTVGHGQKWINMTFKYIYAMGCDRIGGYRHLYDLCHVPIDNVVLSALSRFGFEPLPCKWSLLNDYDLYLEKQRWIRTAFENEPPLDVEFRLWLPQRTPLLER